MVCWFWAARSAAGFGALRDMFDVAMYRGRDFSRLKSKVNG